MTLSEWSGRLHQHFDELRRLRLKTAGDKPLFVLEHGLGKSELQQLSTEVQNHVRTSFPDDVHWLTWIVYAAELGYRYAGDEYWQTFEEETPGWLLRGDRHWIRTCFLRFHNQFSGAKPTGPWAEHFSIICWPITHAILPRDLQRQLARILYELRHSFSAELFEAPETLGEFIAARSWTATSRFQKLAEEPQLLGQIAAALLLQGDVRQIRRWQVLGSVAEIPTRNEAQALLDERMRSANQGAIRPAAFVTFGAFVEEQWKTLVFPTFKASTQHGYKNVLSNHVLPAWKDWRLRDIERLAIQQWVADKFRQDTGWQTVRNAWVLLSGI